MAKDSERRYVQNKSKLPIGILAFVLVILFVVVVVQVSNLFSQNQAIEQQITDLEKQIEEENETYESLKDYQEFMETDDYIEQLARERLNLIKPEEIKMVPVDE